MDDQNIIYSFVTWQIKTKMYSAKKNNENQFCFEYKIMYVDNIF